MGRFKISDTYFEQSLTMCDDVGARSFKARTQADWAAMLLRVGGLERIKQARAMLDEALEVSIAGGYGITKQRAESHLQQMKTD
jgi:hypothetical protein